MAARAGGGRSRPSVGGPAGSGPAVRPGPFDRWADHYERSQLQRMVYGPVHHKVVAHSRRRVPHPVRILDVGCGTGRLSRSFVRWFPGASVVGVDPCAAMIGQAGGGTCAVRLQARAEELPFADGAFDLVVSTLSVRHWQDPYRGLTEISRVTSGGGAVVIADVLLAGPAAVARGGGRPVWRRLLPREAAGAPVAPGGRLSAAFLARVLGASGLRVEQVERVELALATVTVIIAGGSGAGGGAWGVGRGGRGVEGGRGVRGIGT